MKPRALLLSPVVPGSTGNGLSMRAGVWLEVLAETYEVDVFIVPLHPAHATAPAFSRNLCSSTKVAGLTFNGEGSAQLDAESQEKLGELLAASGLVVAFRLSVAALVNPALAHSAAKILDLDDLDWEREVSLGNLELAREIKGHAKEVVQAFDLVTIANSRDVEATMAALEFDSVESVTNVAREPKSQSDGAPTQADLVFVGTLGYQPNVDGLLWFIEQVMPLLDQSVTVAVVGSNPSPELALRENGRFRIHGDVPEIGEFYESAKLAIVPLLAGSGARIKIAEAWAHALPVVSTSVGAEGIELTCGGILADSAEAFADACNSLLQDKVARQEMGSFGQTLWRNCFSLGAAARDIEYAISKASAGMSR